MHVIWQKFLILPEQITLIVLSGISLIQLSSYLFSSEKKKRMQAPPKLKVPQLSSPQQTSILDLKLAITSQAFETFSTDEPKGN